MDDINQDGRDNLSGMDLSEHWHNEHNTPDWAAKNMALLKGFDEIFGEIKGDKNVSA